MNTILMNTISLDDGKVIVKGDGDSGGVTINNQNKSVEIVENGTTEVFADAGFTGLGKVSVNVNVPSSGGGGASAGAVNFRDYDGTILHSYSKDEFLALSELPTLPTQKGLICQEWNYNLDDAKAYVSENGVLEVGATYITDDGKTRLYIKVEGERNSFPFKFSIDKANSLVIDWGDGATESISKSGSQNVSHIYDNIGDYVISFDVADGATLSFGSQYSTDPAISSPYTIMLRKVEIGERTSIRRGAFQSCYALSSVVIPNGVTSIAYCAFSSCYSLSFVVIPNGVTEIDYRAFYSCNSLTSVVIPNGVKGIGNENFSGCTSLSSVVIPNSATYISNKAFYKCYALSSVVIPNSVKSIGEYAFQSCYPLTSVVIPNGVTSIRDYTFNNCSSLTSVVIPDSVTSISQGAFKSCASLTSVVIPDSVTSISQTAFAGCYSLTSVVIPSSITSISGDLFSGCYSLSSVVIPDSVTSIFSEAFKSCASLTSVVIPNGVTSINYETFAGCTSLTSVVIPDSVTSIGGGAFFGCSSLTSIVIPNGVTSIGDEAFNNCSSLTSVVIPNSVTTIGSEAFYYCSSLCFLDFRNHTSVPTLANYNAFSAIASDCKIVVPASLYDEWIAATNWSSHKAKIVSAYTPTECTSLTISADDANCYATSTIIRYEAITNGVDRKGNIINDALIKSTSKSEEFPINTSDEEVLRTVSFTYLGKTATATFKQGKFEPYIVDLNNQWRLSDLENPDASLYDGVYESYSNHNVNNGVATMYLDIMGYTEFTMYIRSDGETSNDYMIVSQPDKVINSSSSTSDTSIVKAHTRNKASSGTAITNYEEVKYENLDGGHHRITILYRKNVSYNTGTDRGYVLIKKQ